jgi:hypothetical protein
MTIVPVYAALLAFLFVYLSLRAIGMRRTLRIAVGDGGNAGMLRAMRVQANFAEYVPLALILLYFAESAGAWVWLVHALGLMLLAGRCLHAYGASQVAENFRFRIAGMMMTFAVIISAAASLLLLQLVRAGG